MAYLNQKPIAQGEITFFPVTPDHFDGSSFSPVETDGNAFIVAHSEKGNHHVIERTDGVDVMEVQSQHEAEGLTILRAIVENPEGAMVVNKDPRGHETLRLPQAIYEARINRELGLDDVIRRTED